MTSLRICFHPIQWLDGVDLYLLNQSDIHTSLGTLRNNIRAMWRSRNRSMESFLVPSPIDSSARIGMGMVSADRERITFEQERYVFPEINKLKIHSSAP